jgi:hypothetical protein
MVGKGRQRVEHQYLNYFIDIQLLMSSVTLHMAIPFICTAIYTPITTFPFLHDSNKYFSFQQNPTILF